MGNRKSQQWAIASLSDEQSSEVPTQYVMGNRKPQQWAVDGGISAVQLYCDKDSFPGAYQILLLSYRYTTQNAVGVRIKAY